MSAKKQVILPSPNLDDMKQVVIDHKTRIYIKKDEDAEEARKRYFEKLEFKKP